jgi:flagella basal body P-ring formation protein FlgA
MKHHIETIPAILNFYMRILFLVLSASASAFILFAGAKAALAATLKPVAVISEEALTVGDIFDGVAAEKASYILGPGPAPGKDMVLDARTLMRIAIALDLPWRPDSSADSVTVRRDAVVIEQSAIDAGLRDALVSKGLDSLFEIAYSAGAPAIALKPGLPATFDVSALELDRTRDTFRATISAPSADDPQAVLNLSGTIRHMVQVPVLKSTLKNGDIIGARDIDSIAVYARDLQSDMVLDGESIVGLTPRRVAPAGKPLRGMDLEAPELVSRGDNVTLVFDSAPLFLTAKGKALQNGGMGDLVRVVNVASNRPIEGIITGAGQVSVTP